MPTLLYFVGPKRPSGYCYVCCFLTDKTALSTLYWQIIYYLNINRLLLSDINSFQNLPVQKATTIHIFNYQMELLNIYPWIILVGGEKNLGNNGLMRASISASGGYHCLVTFGTRFTGSRSWTPTGPRGRRSGPCKYISKSWMKLKN